MAILEAAVGWGSGSGGGGGGNVVPDDGGTPPAVTTRTVTGFVGDATSGQGLIGATVRIGATTVQTGTSGLFTATGVPRTDQTVDVSAAGYLTQTFTLSASTDQINVRLLPTGAGTIEGPPSPPSL